MNIRRNILVCTVAALLCAGIGRADSVSDALDEASRALASSDVWVAVNTSIDSAMTASGLFNASVTRVVPIVGYGGAGGSLRLAQVSGSRSAVTRVRAVLEIDNSGRGEGPWQFTALVPVSSIANNGRGHRVDGVGITALITR